MGFVRPGLAVLVVGGVLTMAGCGSSGDGDPDVTVSGLGLVFPEGTGQVLCGGRVFDCADYGGRCLLDLDAGAQGWDSQVVLCQAASETPLTAPVIPLAFKGGIPLWTPNLDAANLVIADNRSMAVSMTFLSPHLLTTSPERARFLLDMVDGSPYLDGLVSAVAGADEGAMAEALPRVVADVLAQSGLEAALVHGMDVSHVDIEVPGGNLGLSGVPGNPVDFLCRVSEVDPCNLGSEAAFNGADRFVHLDGTEQWRIWVPANSYFKNLMLISKALGAFWKLILPEPGEAPPEHVLSPYAVYDVQCFSGSFGGGADERDADWAFIGAEPGAVSFHNLARAGNLVALSTETLGLFMDFGIVEPSDVYKTISGCALKSMGGGMELSAGLTLDDMMGLVWDVQWCVVESLVKKQANKGVMAVAGFVLGSLLDKVKLVQKVGKAGVALDRLLGMTVTVSPLERALVEHDVDFLSCSPCSSPCEIKGARDCTDDLHFKECVASEEDGGCLQWSVKPCGTSQVCQGDGLCLECGAENQPCCQAGACLDGLTCLDGTCGKGCLEDCPYAGKKECVSAQYFKECGEFDTDPCLEWGASQGCGSGKHCEDGDCVAATCEHECWPPETQCGSQEFVESCGECDGDDCFDFCFAENCGEGLECGSGACLCTTADEDLPGGLPAKDLGLLDDTGVSQTVLDSLWPQGDKDTVGAYVADAGGYVRPRAEIKDVGDGVVYDLCLAFACDSEVNDGTLNSYNCPGANKTTLFGVDACCLYDQTGDAVLEMTEPKCTFMGTGDDSGTVVVRVESIQGEQCWPRYRVILFGG